MPSGPAELHEEWCGRGPHVGEGDWNAQAFLQDAGYRLTRQFFWIAPTPDHEPTSDENSAINYLCWEWDFGGILRPAENSAGQPSEASTAALATDEPNTSSRLHGIKKEEG